MRSTFTALVLATVAITQVVAGPVAHNHAAFHAKKDAAPVAAPLAAPVASELEAPEKREPGWEDVDWSTVKITYSAGQTWGGPTPVAAAVAAAKTAPAVAAAAATIAAAVASKISNPSSPVTDFIGAILDATHASKLITLGFKAVGVNAVAKCSDAWIGADGPYTNKLVNKAKDDIVFVLWGTAASWVNAKQPIITATIPAGQAITVSMASGFSGAWAAVYPETTMLNGQIVNTWGEITTGVYGAWDVSREVNMNGRGMSIEGPGCVSDMDTCVFVCSEGTSCMFNYQLKNCANGSQKNANFGFSGNDPSGGCSYGQATSAAITTTFT